MYTLLMTFLPGYTMYADSSMLVDSTTYFYGNVRFTDDGLKITSKFGILTKDKVIARDSIRILKEELEILGNFGEYFWDREIKLHNGFVARKNQEHISGKEGKYFNDKLWVWGNVKYLNESESLAVFCDEGVYDFNTRYCKMTRSPRFVSPSDSIEIVGDTIELFGDTLAKVTNNVVIKLSGTQCFAGSLIYFPKAHFAWLYGEPRIVTETDSIVGEQMKVTLVERKIHSILVQGNVWGKRWRF